MLTTTFRSTALAVLLVVASACSYLPWADDPPSAGAIATSVVLTAADGLDGYDFSRAEPDFAFCQDVDNPVRGRVRGSEAFTFLGRHILTGTVAVMADDEVAGLFLDARREDTARCATFIAAPEVDSDGAAPEGSDDSGSSDAAATTDVVAAVDQADHTDDRLWFTSRIDASSPATVMTYGALARIGRVVITVESSDEALTDWAVRFMAARAADKPTPPPVTPIGVAEVMLSPTRASPPGPHADDVERSAAALDVLQSRLDDGSPEAADSIDFVQPETLAILQRVDPLQLAATGREICGLLTLPAGQIWDLELWAAIPVVDRLPGGTDIIDRDLLQVVVELGDAQCPHLFN